MSDSEDDDLPELPSSAAEKMAEITKMLQNEMIKNPSQFVSHWEMDEQDVDEATEDEIKNDPVKRILWAAETGKIDVVEELLQNSSELINAIDSDGYTPLHRAAYEGHTDIIKLLIERGLKVDARTNDGWTPLHSAANWGQTNAAAVLLRYGADINAQTEGKLTPLHLAATNATNIDIFQLLLTQESLDPSIKNALGETARDVAVRTCKHHKMFDSLEPSVHSFY